MIKKVVLHILLKLKYSKYRTKIKSYNVARNIKLGWYCTIGKKAYIDSNVEIGNYSYVNATQLDTIIESNTIIGDFCSIAPGVIIGMGNHYVEDVVTTHPILFDKYYMDKMGYAPSLIKLDGLRDKDDITVIGSDVWIGARANVKRGITIGNGAIIAADAVVTKNVPDYAIVAGVPAKVIGYRFSEEQRNVLIQNEKNCFWNWNREYIIKNINILYDINQYVSLISK